MVEFVRERYIKKIKSMLRSNVKDSKNFSYNLGLMDALQQLDKHCSTDNGEKLKLKRIITGSTIVGGKSSLDVGVDEEEEYNKGGFPDCEWRVLYDGCAYDGADIVGNEVHYPYCKVRLGCLTCPLGKRHRDIIYVDDDVEAGGE